MNKKAEELLADHITINSPKILLEVAESLRSFIEQGLIQEVGGDCSVNDIQKNKPWPNDIINIEFETIPGGSRYILNCETYHGAGGVFKKK